MRDSWRTLLLAAFLFCWLGTAGRAEDHPACSRIFVNNLTGDDSRTGDAAKPGNGSDGPVKTIMRAFRLAKPGVVIELASTGTDYRETVQIEGWNLGSAAAPLVLEGNGACISGLVEIPTAFWIPAEGGLVYLESSALAKLAPLGGMPKSNWLWHWKRQSWWHEPEAPSIFFLDGKAAPHAHKLEDIEPGGFFYNVNTSPLRIWFRPPVGKTIDQCRIDLPGNRGVIINDDHVVIRNLGSRYSSDDGFSTFLAVSAVFQNICGAYNCDQGISLHNSTSGVVEGGIFEHNGGCGIVDVMNTQSTYLHMTIRDNMVAGAHLAGASHNLQSCWLIGNRGPQVVVCSGTRVNLLNCLVQGYTADGGRQTGVDAQGDARVDHSTINGCGNGVVSSGTLTLTNSILADCDGILVKAARLSAERTLFDQSGTLETGGNRTALKPESWRENKAAAELLKACFVEAVNLPILAKGLPEDHPRYNALGNGTRLGAVLSPRETWLPEEPVEIVPATIFTHNVGRRSY